MVNVTSETPDDNTPKPKPVTIEVNNRTVQMPDREATGTEIKHHAQVPAEFMLYREHGGKLEPVADDETIKLHDNERFRAVSGQDVS
jgi:hypothetical protein